MQDVDMLIKNGTILCMDENLTSFQRGFLCLKRDRITHIGEGEPPEFLDAKLIDAKGGIILPGLINAHTHAAMTLFRGLADDLPLMEWLQNYIFPVEQRMKPDFVFYGTLLACAEMILSGTATFCDMYLFEQEVAEAAQTAGMRCLVGEVLYDFPSPNYGTIDKGLKYTEDLIARWRDSNLVNIAVEPHSLFTCNPDLLRAAGKIASTNSVPLVLHVAETRQEVEEITKKYGRRPIEYMEYLDLLGNHIIADHCVHLESKDMETMASYGVKVVHNPESNMKLASGIAPIPEMLAKGITVALGTDGCASNNNLDLFTEMDMAAKLHKVKAMDPTVMDAVTVLKMATIEGAKVLGMEHIIGSLETGKKADLIIVDTNRPHLTPLYDPYSHLVYSAKGSDVTCSIINGELVMENRRLLNLDLEKIISKAHDESLQVKEWVS